LGALQEDSTLTTRLAVFVIWAATASLAACAEVQDQGMHPEVAPSPAPASCGAVPPLGKLCGCVYDVPEGTRRIPDFGALRPVELLCVDRLAVGVRNGPPGFPGVTGRFEWFGIDFHGTVLVTAPGVYTFRLASDDGARLYVDDALVLNNDGRHDVQSVEGAAALEPGLHRLRVPFYDGPGPMALTLEVARPGQDFEILQLDRPL
jgi:hypothetical protein